MCPESTKKKSEVRKRQNTEGNFLLKPTLVDQKLWNFPQIFRGKVFAFVLLGVIVSACAKTQRGRSEKKKKEDRKRAGYMKRFPEICSLFKSACGSASSPICETFSCDTSWIPKRLFFFGGLIRNSERTSVSLSLS